MDLNNNVALGHSKVMLLMRYIANAIRTFYMLDIKYKYVSCGGAVTWSTLILSLRMTKEALS